MCAVVLATTSAAYGGGMEFSMKKIISMLLAVAFVCGALLTLTSCGAPKDAGAQISVYLGAEVFDFDPTDYYVDSNAEQVMSLMYEPLFKLDSDGDLKCAAAKSYSVDEDDREIVIKLRESYWSDEIRVKAEDFIYAWREVLLDPGCPNPAASLLYDIENAIAIKAGDATYSDLGAVATGTYEITVTYREGADYKQLLKNMASIATSPLRQDVVSIAKTYWSKSITTIVTNGPFKLETLDHEIGDFTLARNLGYHQKSTVENYTDNVTPASLVSFIVTDGALELTYDDIVNKTVFYMGDATLADRANNSEKATYADDLSTYTYVFNTEKAIFKNKNVRRALSLALDRAAIAEAVTFGKAATGFLPDAVAKSLYGKTVEERISSDYAANLAIAKQLIDDAGLTASQKRFTLTINDDEESIAIAELAKAAWAQLGFVVTIDKVDSIKSSIIDTTLEETLQIEDSKIQYLVKEASYGNRKFDVIAVDWQMLSTDPMVALSAFTSHMNGNGADFKTDTHRLNISGWSSALYDAYINAAFLTDDEDVRAEALKNAENLLIESAPVIPVIYNQSFAFISKDLSSISFDGFGNFVLTKVKQKNYEDYLPSSEEE